mgnify:CR=1 FL=1
MTENEQNIEVMRDLRNRLDKVLETAETNVPSSDYKHPDPLKHKYISFAKSALRIAAGLTLAYGMIVEAGGLLILAEILGIVEEMV